MTAQKKFRRLAQCGFSLAEIIVVIIVLGIGSLGVIALQDGLFTQVKQTQEAQTVSFRLQSCAEKIIAVRRELGIDAATNASCSEFQTTVSVSNWVPISPDNIAFPPCTLNNAGCKKVTITPGNVFTSLFATDQSVSFLLVPY